MNTGSVFIRGKKFEYVSYWRQQLRCCSEVDASSPSRSPYVFRDRNRNQTHRVGTFSGQQSWLNFLAYNASYDGVKLSQSFRESSRTWLKNVGRLNLVQLIVTNGSDVRPPFTSANKILFDL